MCTLHANSAREALVKMCTLPLLAGENISAAFVVPTVASAVDLVLHLGTDAQGRRRVREVVGVTGRTEGEVIETSDIFTTVGGVLRRADGFPPHPDRYASSGVDLAGLLAEHGLAASGTARSAEGER
jgi:pilus assembly protein CpaF